MNRKDNEDQAEEAERQELLPIDSAKNERITPKIMTQRTENDPDPPNFNDEDRDPIAECIGNYGKWQLKMTFLLSLCSFPCTFHIFSPTFIAAASDYWCSRPKHLQSVDQHLWRNVTQPKGACTIVDYDWSSVAAADFPNISIPDRDLIACKNWEFDNGEMVTVISEWFLVCDREYIATLSEVLFLFGIAVGGVVSGLISDRFGRKKTLITALIFQCSIAVSLAFCPWVELYLALRVILGFFSVAVVFSAFVIIVEIVGGKWRTICGVCNFFPLPVSYIIVSLLSMAFPNWRHLQLAISLPGFALLFLWWVVPESPNWLLVMGRIPKIKRIFAEVSEYNNRPLPASIDKILQPNVKKSNEQAAGLFDLFRGSMGKITVCNFIIWFATTLVYYGLVLNIGSFGGNLHITSVISGVVELPAIAISIPILMKVGRRYPISLSLIVAGGFCLAAAVAETISDITWLKIALMMISKFSVGATNGVLPTFTAELYPTLMRNLGVGASQVSAGIALVCIPYMWLLANVEKFLPMVITGSAGIIGGLCVLLLPETLNRSLAV